MHVTAPRVDELVPDGAAAAAGFKPGDVILSIDGQPIETFTDMQRIVSGSADRELTFEVDRGGTQPNAEGDARPVARSPTGSATRCGSGMIGIRRNADPAGMGVQALRADRGDGAGRAGDLLHRLAHAVLSFSDVVMGGKSADQLGGPIRIAEVSGQVASVGFVPLLNLTAVLSVSIGLINLFPIPLLDGGHLLFYLIEAVRAQTAERAHAGDRFPHRVGGGADAHDVCDLE